MSLLTVLHGFDPHSWYPASGLTGGTPGSLDSIDGSLLNDGDRSIVITDSSVYFYILNASSGTSESSPDTISPDTNAGDKRWELVQMISS